MTTKKQLRRRIEELKVELAVAEIERDAYHSELEEANKLLADTDDNATFRCGKERSECQ